MGAIVGGSARRRAVQAPRSGRIRAALTAISVVVAGSGLALGSTSAALAAGAPTDPWAITAGGSVANVTLNALGLGSLSALDVSRSTASANSKGDPRTSGVSQNLGSGLVTPTLRSISAGGSSGSGGSTTGTIAAVSTPLLNAGALTTADEAHWTADSACVLATKLSGSTTSVDSIAVLPTGYNGGPLLTTGAGTATGSTVLSQNSGLNYGTTSTSTGSIAGVSVLGGQAAGGVTIGVTGLSTLTAIAPGSGTGSSTYTPSTVTVNGAGLAPGQSTTVTVPLVGTVRVTLNTPTTTVSGTSVTASVSLLTVQITLSSGISATVGILPLASTATAPTGGIDCPPPPAAPVILLPAEGTVTAVTTPTVTGTAPAGSAVTLYDTGGTTVLGTTTANGTTGAWSVVASTLAQGAHAFTAKATTASGTSAASNVRSIVVDSVAPAKPTLVNPADGLVTSNPRPAITGSAEAAGTVTVYVDGAKLGTTTATGGAFSFTPPADLTETQHTAYVTVTDAAGNVSVASDTHTFTIDRTTPTAPVVTTPANGTVTASAKPALSGTAEANSTVTLTVTGQNHAAQTFTTTANGSGAFSTAPGGAGLADDVYTVSATATDAAGNVSAQSNVDSFTVDTTRPAPPVVATPANLSTVTTRTPLISGTAEANSTVTVYLGTAQANAVAIGTASSNGTGDWSLVSPSLADGTHAVFATSADAAGNTSLVSNVNTFTVDATPPAAPTVTTPADGSLTNQRRPTLSGTAELGTTVTVSVDGTEVGTATTTASGTWSLPQPTDLADGQHRISAVAKDAAGNSSPVSATNRFTVDATPPATPVTVYPANGSSTRNSTPAIGGTTSAGTTVTVYVDGTAHPATVAANGTDWSYAPTAALGEGPHTVKATATDAAGNTSAFSNANTFTVDTSAPAAPLIQTPTEGEVTADTTPTISGTAEAGSTVTVTLNGAALPAVVTAANGIWSTAPTSALANGGYTASATAADAAGNVSAASADRPFTVNTTVTPPTITTPADGSTITTRTPTYTGTAPSGASTVSVSVDGALLAAAVPVITGGWSVGSVASLPDGQHTVTVVTNTGVASATTTFTVDATAPSRPVITAPTEGQHVGTTTPTISGTAEAGSTVRVTFDPLSTPVKTATTTARADGTWSLTAPTLAEGDHSVFATATDAAGNVSNASTVVDFTVDTTKPAAPTVALPADGSTISTHTPTYSGHAEAGSTVTVSLGGASIGTTTADTTTGDWSLASPGYLADGGYSVTATATDAAGNTSASSSANAFTIDTTPPVPPTITTPAEGALVATATPTISGGAEPNSTVTVSIDGVSLGTTGSSPSGIWSLTPTTPLDQGLRHATATATDAQGNVSDPSAVRSFTVDSVAPAAPTIATPANGTVTNDATPPFTGAAEKGSTVAIVVTPTGGGSAITYSTTASSTDGSWSSTPTTGLPDGGYSVYATATDAAGNVSAHSASNSFEIDTSAPPVAITGPANGSTTNERRPPITGTSQSGAAVTVTLAGTTYGPITVGSTGAWTVTPGSDLADGSHTASAVATDAAGNSSATASTTFTVDTVAPAAPVITSPANGSTISNPTPTVTGTAEPGAKVRVLVDTTGYGSVTADPTTGAWSIPTTATLAQGSHTATATATDGAGNASGATTSTFTVDTTAPGAPVISAPADGAVIATATPTVTGTAEKGASVAVAMDGAALGTVTASLVDGSWSIPSSHLGDGTHHVAGTATDAAGNVSGATTNTFTVDTVAPGQPTITTPTANAQLNTHLPLFTGAGDPGSAITVRVDGASDVAATSVGTNGSWSVTATTSIADGTHTAVAIASDAAGNTATSAAVPFTIDTVAPAAPTIAYPANGSTITDTTPTITGSAEADSSVAVTLDSAALGTVTTSPGGVWSIPVATALSPGSHTATAAATDAAGNTSPTTASVFTVDPAALAAPVITSPQNGSSTNVTTPPISGTGIAGAIVTVAIDGTPSTTTVGTDGRWTLTPTAPLADGDHVITATQRVGAGPVSATSDPVRFTVDTTPPSDPVITGPAPGTLTDDPYPTILGTADPGSTVTVYADGTPIGTTVADSTGHFSLRSAIRLADGVRRLTARSRDAAGNVSGTTPVPITVDTAPPAPPTITSPAPVTTTSDPTPTITGTGEPGTTVTIRADGRVLGEAYVAEDGAWRFKVPTPLASGTHRFTATARDRAGNVSDLSIQLTIVIRGSAALPGTGLDQSVTLDLSSAAFALLLLGALLLRASRRRRTRESRSRA